MGDFRALNVVDSFTLAVSNTAIGLSSATPPLINGKMSGRSVRRMVISVSTDAIRWRADGTDPSATVGHLIDADGYISFTGANYESLLQAIKFIRVTNDAALFGTCFD
jgi:hypothetical protein